MSDKFTCKRCGECCTGSPKLSKSDIKRILKSNIKKDEFIEIINGIAYMKMENNKCVFLEKKNKTQTYCKIYDLRPEICRLYPEIKTGNCQPEKWAFDEYLERKKNEKE